MQKRTLGRTDLQVTPLGFGGAELGFQTHDGQAAISKLLNQAIDSGLNVIDTASAYKESEALIGNAINARRKEIYLFTKCGATDGFARKDWTRKGIAQQLDQSLKLLKTDYVDLLQLHSCDSETLRQGEAIRALEDARKAGKTRYIGYSGDGDFARAALELNVFDTLQTSINIADQQALTLTLPLAATKQIGVIAKRPIANVAWRTGKLPDDSYHHVYFERLKSLNFAFLAAPLEQAALQALYFTLSQQAVSVAIVGTTKPGRFEENLNALCTLALDPSMLQSIRDRWLAVADASWVGQV